MFKKIKDHFKNIFNQTGAVPEHHTPIELGECENDLKFYKLRPATVSDIDFIVHEVILGTAGGHFNFSPDKYELQKYFQRIILEKFLIRPAKPVHENLFADLFIYIDAKLVSVGFLLMAESYPGSRSKELEILMVGISKDYQKRRLGENLIRLVVEKYCSVNLYARCFLPSMHMAYILEKSGFSCCKILASGTKELRFTKTS